MAIDTAEKRRLVMNSGLGGVDVLYPSPDGDLAEIDKTMLLHGYYIFSVFIDTARHALAMYKLWPARSLLNNE